LLEEVDPRAAMVLLVRKFLLGLPTWFATMTFRNVKTTALGASSALRLWLSTYNRHNPSDPCRSLVWSAELQQRGTAHIHALLVGMQSHSFGHCEKCTKEGPLYRILKESWYHHHGLARFRPYDDSVGAGGMAYVLKYILSDSCEEWGLWENGKDF
jgi:hypothetical protein